MYSCETVWVKDGCRQILQYKHYTIKNNQCVRVVGRRGGGRLKDMEFLAVLKKYQVDFPGVN